MKDTKGHLAALALAATLTAATGAHAQERERPTTSNLGSATAIAAQPAGVYRDDRRDRRNALIALGAVAVGAAIAVGAFDSSDSHETPPITTPPSHDS